MEIVKGKHDTRIGRDRASGAKTQHLEMGRPKKMEFYSRERFKMTWFFEEIAAVIVTLAC